MKKIALALAASLASAPAMAGVYLNAESNASYTGNDYTSRTTELHIGYEGEVGQLGYYVQGGLLSLQLMEQTVLQISQVSSVLP